MVKNLTQPRKNLARARTDIGNAMETLVRVMEQVGKTPLPDDWPVRTPGEHTCIGEELYGSMLLLATVHGMTEDLTNYLRSLEGLEPFDYIDSPSTLFMATMQEGIQREGLQYRLDRLEGGSPV